MNTSLSPRALRSLLTALVLALSLLAAACSAMPDHGPVVQARVPQVADDTEASDIDPLPPSKAESATELVQGFLDAMQASPIRLDVAREYLSASARGAWDPGASTVTYAYKLPPRDRGSEITVRLGEAERLDRNGAWRGRLSPSQQVLHLHTVIEDGEFRIDNPPNSLIVPASWFAQRFRQASLFFFDQSARILVPQPVFVQRGGQFASALVAGLLAGPGEDLRGVVRSFLPPGLRVGLSVPVSRSGVAEVNLVGDLSHLSPNAVRRVLAQLAWTLRQEPDIKALTLSLNREPVRLPGDSDDYPIDEADRYDPTGYHASTKIFALRSGLLASAYTSDFEPLVGPLSDKPNSLRSVSVDLAGDRAVGVTADGSAIVSAPIAASNINPGAVARRIVTGGTDFLKPAWDFTGRLWLVDRNNGHARVSYLDSDGRRTSVHVPGVSGRDVKRFLVSRDATRFVAVVPGPTTDEVRVGRIAVDQSGVMTGLPSTVVAGTRSAPMRIRDLAWTSTTTLAALSPLVPGRVSEVRTVVVDGSPTSSDDLTTTVAAPVIGLAGSPAPGLAPFAVTPTGLVDLSTNVSANFEGASVTSIDYAG